MNDAKRRRFKAVLFVLILLMHAIIFWFLFYKPFPPMTLLPQSVIQKESHAFKTPSTPPNDWATMRAGGAPVILHQTAPQESQQETTQTENDAIQEAPTPDPAPEAVEPEPKEDSYEERAFDESIKSALTSLVTNVEIKKTAEKESKEIIKSEKKEYQEAVTKAQATPPTPPAQKIIPFAQLVDGFSRQLSDGGTDPYSMNGSKIGKATAEQLKHGNYRNKIAECIQKSILTNRAKAVIRNDGHYALTINLSIGRSGALHHLSIKESCGVPTLDLFILKTVQDASSSFPPVPASLGSDIYPMPIFFENIIAIIQHPEQLRWTL